MVDLVVSWDISISYNSLLTGLWLLPLSHLDTVRSVSFTPEVLSYTLCLKPSPDFLPSHGMKAKVLTVGYKNTSHLFPSAPCSLCSIHIHLLIFLPSSKHIPFQGGEGELLYLSDLSPQSQHSSIPYFLGDFAQISFY